MCVIAYFIHVCMDKHIQATEEIQAQVLESCLIVYIPIVTFVPLSFSNVYVYISQTSMQTEQWD